MKEVFQGDKKVGHSLLHGPEEKLKKILIPLVPQGVETYHLTLTTIAWSLLIIFFSFLAQSDIRWLWGASAMIIAQYITDLLDGAIGRQRNTGLIKWGYYMDHFLDYIFLCAILIGYSMLVRDHHKYMLFFILALFGAFMVNSFLSFAATNEFQISYLGIGPTEIRIVFIIVNTLLIIFSDNQPVERFIPYILWFSTFGLFIAVYRTQEHIWDIDMRNKYGEEAVLKAKEKELSFLDYEWSLYLSGRKIIRNLGFSFLIASIALVVLMMRFMAPHHRFVAAGIYIISWIPFLLSFKDKLALLKKRGKQVKTLTAPHLPYILTAILLGVSAYVAQVLIPVEDTNLVNMTAGSLREELDIDLQKTEVLESSMNSLSLWIKERSLLTKAVDKLSATEREEIRRYWSQFANLSLELDILKSKYKSFYQIDRLTKPSLHADAFCVQFTAFTAQYRASLHLVNAVDKNPFMDTLLNEADARQNIPANCYSKIKQHLANPQVTIRLNAWTCYLPLVKKDFSEQNQLACNLEQDIEDIYKTLGKHPSLLVKIPRDLFERKAFAAWFPFQKEVALHIGRIRDVTHEYRISPDIISKHLPELEPGDVVVERRNWKMSNAGIPGFWPHVALYTGTPEKIDAYFNGITMLGGAKPTDYIKTTNPDAYLALCSLDDHGYQHAVIEALEPGIIFTSAEYSLNADYIGIIRPRLTKEQKFQGLLTAMSHFRKPYDFNFDFTTDSKLVCSELVYKSYRDFPGITLTPAQINGRLLITPNSLVETFDSEYGTGKQQFDFVLFLDSSEKTGEVAPGDINSFRTSWKRPKWDLLMQ